VTPSFELPFSMEEIDRLDKLARKEKQPKTNFEVVKQIKN
jgi:hypothetical protein